MEFSEIQEVHDIIENRVSKFNEYPFKEKNLHPIPQDNLIGDSLRKSDDEEIEDILNDINIHVQKNEPNILKSPEKQIHFVDGNK